MTEIGRVERVYSKLNSSIILEVRCSSEEEISVTPFSVSLPEEEEEDRRKIVSTQENVPAPTDSVVVNNNLSQNISIQTFASGTTSIHIKDYYGSNGGLSKKSPDSDSAIEDGDDESDSSSW